MPSPEPKASETIVRLAGRGDGVTESGRYVARAAPGDIVHVAGDTFTIEPGPNHAEPPCVHFGRCGGCQMQHVSDDAYAGWARDRISHALSQHGVGARDILPVQLSSPRTRRRAALRARRTGRAIELGFNAEASHDIVDLRECHVLLPELFALLPALRDVLAGLIADRQTIGITLTAADNGIDLLLSNLSAEGLKTIDRLTRFAVDQRLARLAVEDSSGTEIIAMPSAPVVAFDGVAVDLPTGSFLQATREGEGALVAAAGLICGDAARIADLFCGVGTFALPLSRSARVFAVDASRAAVQALDLAARRARRHVETAHRDLFRNPLRAAELKGFDVAVVDPPRAGAKEQMVEIGNSKLPCVAAISCNPATFARDARILVDQGFALTRLWPVAQFRWSTHLELAAEFRR